MDNNELRLYAALSRVPFLNSYLGKIFTLAFLGTHVPLLALIAHLIRDPRLQHREKLRVVVILGFATLFGTAATLWALWALLAPVALVCKTLRRYLDEGEIPDLPTGYPDRAGRLMADVQYAVERLDTTLRSLGELATKDQLTNTLNRRGGEERLAQDVARAQRGGGSLMLAMVDLDQFKTINDRHGHHAGDVCLKHFTGVLARNVREGDWIARWGGDEFVVGMWYRDKEPSIERVLERVAEDLHENPALLPNGEEVRLSFSGGVCQWRAGDGAGELLPKVDKALYRAKGAGKNTIVHVD